MHPCGDWCGSHQSNEGVMTVQTSSNNLGIAVTLVTHLLPPSGERMVWAGIHSPEHRLTTALWNWFVCF
jgi:hypothetical protein